MNRFVTVLAVAAVAFTFVPPTRTQEREDRTLLGWNEMRAIINEVSGERPLQTVLELVPYPRIRPRSEYQGNFRETVVMDRLAKEYGFQNVEIESFPSGAPLWYASRGELWMVEPENRKLYDIYDVAVSLCAGSESGDVTAELVDVGSGARSEDYAGKDVKGKIALGWAASGALQRQAVFERGAVGVISYNSLRPDDYPNQIASQSVSGGGAQGRKAGFGWSAAPRVGRELARRLALGATIRLRSIVAGETFPGEMEMVHAVIPGDGTSEQEIMVSAHLYEGYTKQGANDDNSGCAATLEMGRAFLRLVQDGKLPKPKRTIHFLWVPEISGTMAWLNRHGDTKKKIVADLNFDMEGLGLRTGLSQWVMHRTPDTFPTFLNDVGASVLEFVANLNRERVRYRHNGYGFTLPVVSPRGSLDPFYYIIDKHYGASDHVVYMNQGIPALMFITWPDMFYHSSEDTPDKLDSTQFKRASVVGASCMAALAVADDSIAGKITAEALARGSERMGANQRKGLSYLADAQSDASSLLAAYKEALVAVRHQASIEKTVVQSSSVLYAKASEAESRLAAFHPLIDQRAADLLNEIRVFYELTATRHGLAQSDPTPTDEEKKAARTAAERVGSMGGFGRGMGGGQDALSAQDRAALQKIPGHMTAELNILLDRKKKVLEIRDFLSGEFEPLPLADLMDYLNAQQRLGRVKLTELPEEPPAPTVPARKPARKK